VILYDKDITEKPKGVIKMREYKTTVYHMSGMVIVTQTKRKPTYEVLRKAVGGLIQYVPIRKVGKEIIVNEEGIIYGLPENPHQPSAAMGTEWEGYTFLGNIIQIETVKI
jgi:hypothetical protein